jgi:hypothetical protein
MGIKLLTYILSYCAFIRLTFFSDLHVKTEYVMSRSIKIIYPLLYKFNKNRII